MLRSVFILLSLTSYTVAFGQDIDRLIIFGDSLSNAGQLVDTISTVLPKSIR